MSKTISAPRLSFLIQVADASANTKGTSRATRSEMRDLGAALRELERLRLERDTPHTVEFVKAVELEALHQRERWAAEHDAGKTDADWFWLIGYLAGKALHKPEKQLHHIITTAAACLNWHAMKTGNDTRMRPGIDPATAK